jgi:hypothetical protein
MSQKLAASSAPISPNRSWRLNRGNAISVKDLRRGF